MRPGFLRLVFFGGIGMYQIKAHIKRKMNKFKPFFSNTYFWARSLKDF